MDDSGRGRPLQHLVAAAYAAWDAQDWDAAAAALSALVAAAREQGSRSEDLPGWTFDLALAHKFRRDWPQALACGVAAAELAPEGPGEPVWWNLGIAATAAHDWPTARRAWARFGVDVPPGEGPIEGSFGRAPVRIATQGGPEVVWCRRIDPARAVILNVPVAGSGRRCGETVLHDGVPNGERVTPGGTYPVFDELALWAPSAVPVHAVEIRVAGSGHVAALESLADADGIVLEAWDTVTPLCAACSEGSVDQRRPHEHAAGEAGAGRCRVGVAAPADAVAALLRRWVDADPRGRGAGTPEAVA